MKKLGVVITDGVGFRNFIASDFLTEAEKRFDEVVILSCLPKEVYAAHTLHSKIIELPVFQEKFKTWFFRKCKEIAHLQLHQQHNFGIYDNLHSNFSQVKTARGSATRFIFKLTTIFKSEKWIQRFNKLQQTSFKNHPVTIAYKQILETEQVDLLFFTHQRPPYVAPLVFMAERLKIKTAAFIFSWDNLASKGRMAANFDNYLVWSELMKTELLQFYAQVKAENISVVGTPQFEPYVLDRYKSTKEDFLKKFNLDGTKKTICFSCGDISTSKNDELYIETLAKAILNNELPAVNLLVRTSPAEDPIRFASMVEKFPFIKWNYPKWNLSRQGHQEEWSQRIPTTEDIVDLRSVLEYSDLNVNMLSTMSLDFMQFEKPVINPVFGNVENGLYNDQRFLEYKHIKHVVDSKASKVAKNEKELIDYCNLYLNDPTTDQLFRQNLLKLQVSKPLHGTGERISKVLFEWI
jgi:hypothetical protein